jgi:hypothetical protein
MILFYLEESNFNFLGLELVLLNFIVIFFDSMLMNLLSFEIAELYFEEFEFFIMNVL